MNKITIVQSGRPTLEFEGKLLAEVSSQNKESERWTVLKVYEAKSGRIVTVVLGETIHPDEVTRIRASTFDDMESITKVFKNTKLARRLYKRLKFTPSVQT